MHDDDTAFATAMRCESPDAQEVSRCDRKMSGEAVGIGESILEKGIRVTVQVDSGLGQIASARKMMLSRYGLMLG